MLDNDHETVQLQQTAKESTLTNSEGVRANVSDFDPSELLAGSLAKCTESTVRRAAAREGIEIDKLVVKVDYMRNKECRVSSLEVQVHLDLEGNLTDQQLKKLQKASETSYIRRVLAGEISLSSQVVLNETRG